MTKTLDHCHPDDFPCWQHYGAHNASCSVTQWVLDLSRAYLNLRVRALNLNPSDDNVNKVMSASHKLQSLYNQRWRDVNREPFDFAPFTGKESSDEMPAMTERVYGLLDALGIKPAQAPLPRRQL